MHTIIIPRFLISIVQNHRMQQFLSKAVPISYFFVHTITIEPILHIPLQRNKYFIFMQNDIQQILIIEKNTLRICLKIFNTLFVHLMFPPII